MWAKHGKPNQKWKILYVSQSPFKNGYRNGYPQTVLPISSLNNSTLSISNSNENETTELEKLRTQVKLLTEENQILKEENKNLSKAASPEIKKLEVLSYEELEAEESKCEATLALIRKQMVQFLFLF